MRLSRFWLVSFLATILFVSLTIVLSKAFCKDNLLEDVNGDGKVDMLDFFMAVESFGSYPDHLLWNPNADINSDGIVELFDLYLISLKFGCFQLSSAVDIHPKTLNLKSQGRWITVYMEFLEDCNITEIDLSTLKLNETISAEIKPVNFENNTLMVKFSRAALESYIMDETNLNNKFTKVTLTVSGELDGTSFSASDSIIAIAP